MTTSGASEAGHIALSKAVEEVLFLRRVQNFMEPSMRIGAVNVLKDNKGAIKLAVNKHFSRRIKHIDVKHNLVRDACNAGKLRVVDVKTEDQHADLFTKPPDIQKFHKHAKIVLNVV